MDQVDEVKQKTDIVALVGERVKLTRAGRNFRALCPFHSERTPSFMVSPDLQIYKCFGCGKAGDVYTFLEEFEGREFPEALSYLAQRAGVKLEPIRKGRDYQKKERLFEVNHLASEYFHYLFLEHAAGERARRYLAERGIRKQAIESFFLGFAPDNWDNLIRFLVGKKKYRLSELSEAGLVVQGRKGAYDRFRNRVIFPLRDVRGNVLGFAGRVLPGEEGRSASAEATADIQAKYINSPETLLYHKSQHLYGLHENRSFIKKADQAVVVEGELDAISSWQAGVRNVVAVKGTALTKEQIELVRRYTRNIILSLDADTAGDAATKRGISLADSASLNINVTLLSGGKDPDAISQHDPKKWRQLVERATSVYDFYIASTKKRFDLTSGLGKKQAAEELAPLLSAISNAVEQAHYVKKTARLLDVSEDAVVDVMARAQRAQALGVSGGASQVQEPSDQGRERGKTDRRTMLEEYLLSLMLKGGNTALERLNDVEVKDVSHPALRRIFERLFEFRNEAFEVGAFVASLPAELQETAQAAYLMDLAADSDSPDFTGKEVERVVHELNLFNLRVQLADLSSKITALESRKRLNASEEKTLAALQRRFSDLSGKLSD